MRKLYAITLGVMILGITSIYHNGYAAPPSIYESITWKNTIIDRISDSVNFAPGQYLINRIIDADRALSFSKAPNNEITIDEYERELKKWEHAIHEARLETESRWNMQLSHIRKEISDPDIFDETEISHNAALHFIDETISRYQRTFEQELDRLILQAERRVVARYRNSIEEPHEEKLNPATIEKSIRKEIDTTITHESTKNPSSNAAHITHAPKNIEELSDFLRQWEEEENQFLEARVAWEHEARTIYLDAEKQWEETFQNVYRYQNTWKQDFTRIVEDGYQEWQSLYTNFKELYQHNIDRITTETQQRLENYNIALSALHALDLHAQESLKKALTFQDKIQFNIEMIDSTERDAPPHTLTKEERMAAWQQELEYWELSEAEARKTLDEVSQEYEILEREMLQLYRNRGNAHQRELHRLHTTRQLLKNEIEIAKAVLAYDDDPNFEENYRQAQLDVENLQKEYRDAIAARKTAHQNIMLQQAIVEEKSDELEHARNSYSDYLQKDIDEQNSTERRALHALVIEATNQYHAELNLLDQLSDLYHDRTMEVARIGTQSEEAYFDFRVAQEIYDYAIAPPHSIDYEAIVVQREHEYNKIDSIMKIMTEEKRRAYREGTYAAPGEEYREARRQQIILRDAYLYLQYIKREIQQNFDSIQQEIVHKKNNLEEKIEAFFNFELDGQNLLDIPTTLNPYLRSIADTPPHELKLLSKDLESSDEFKDNPSLYQSINALIWMRKIGGSSDSLFSNIGYLFFINQDSLTSEQEIPFVLEDYAPYRNIRDNSNFRNWIGDITTVLKNKLADESTPPIADDSAYQYFERAMIEGRVNFDLNIYGNLIGQKLLPWFRKKANYFKHSQINSCFLFICPYRDNGIFIRDQLALMPTSIDSSLYSLQQSDNIDAGNEIARYINMLETKENLVHAKNRWDIFLSFTDTTAHQGNSDTLTLLENLWATHTAPSMQESSKDIIDTLLEIIDAKTEENDRQIAHYAQLSNRAMENRYDEYFRIVHDIEAEGITPHADTLRTAIRALFFQDSVDSEQIAIDELRTMRNMARYHPFDASMQGTLKKDALLTLYAQQQNIANTQLLERFNQQEQDFGLQLDWWEKKIESLTHAATNEWDFVKNNIKNLYIQWQHNFQKDYVTKSALWNDRYRLFMDAQNKWIDTHAVEVANNEAAYFTAQAGIEQIVDPIPLTRHTLRSLPIIMRVISPPPLSQLIESTVESSSLSRIMRRAAILTSRPSILHTPIIDTNTPLYSSSTILRKLSDFIEKNRLPAQERTASILTLQLQKAIIESIDRIANQVTTTNRSAHDNFDRILTQNGYNLFDDIYRRKTAIDRSLISGYEYEFQLIEAYRYLKVSPFEFRQQMAGTEFDVIQSKLKKTAKRLKIYTENIFDEESGEFAIHIGDAPEPDERNPERLQHAGSGESGRILGVFFINEARFNRGLQTYTQLWYDIPLWDSDKNNDGKSDFFLGAPSLRGLGAIIAGLFGPEVSAIYNVVMAGLDILHGKDILKTAFNVGKSLLTSAIGVGIGEIFTAVDTALLSGAELIIGETVKAGAETLFYNLTGGIINSIRLDENNALYFNQALYTNRLIGTEALGSYAGTAAHAATSAALTGGSFGFSARDKKNLRSFTSFAGGALGAGVEAAITGEIKLNLFSGSDIENIFGIQGLRNNGLLELRIGGDNTGLTLGGQGFQIGASRVTQAIQGIDIWRENMRIIDFSRNGVEFAKNYRDNRDPSSLLRIQYSSRDADPHIARQYERLLAGVDTLRVGVPDSDPTGARALANFGARTIGTLEPSRGRIVHLATIGQRRDADSQLRAGVILGHEAHRDGIIGNSITQKKETIQSVLAHTLLAERIAQTYGSSFFDENLRADLRALNRARTEGIIDPIVAHTLNNYDYSDDYWKLTKDGRIIWDGKEDLTDWNGNLLIEDRTGSLAQSLIRYLGIEQSARLLNIDPNLIPRTYSTLSAPDAGIPLNTLLSHLNENRRAFYLLAAKNAGIATNQPLTQNQWQQALGELLLSSPILDFEITERAINGQIYFSDTLIDGEYEKFVVDAHINRNRKSYRSKRGDLSSQALDNLITTKRNLDGEIIDQYVFESLQTVDIYDSLDPYNINRNQPVFHPEYGQIQGNTIAAGELWLKFGVDSKYAGSALLINRARTISGHYIDELGFNSIIGGGEWLLHSNRLEGMINDFNNKNSDGCFISSTLAHLEYIARLEEWGIKPGYNIVAQLQEFGTYPTH